MSNIVEDEDKYDIDLTRKETLEIINQSYEKNSNVLPPMNISDNEWNSFYHVMESHLLAHHLQGKFDIIVKTAIVYAINLSQKPGVEELNMFLIKKSLCNILFNYGILSDEVKAMCEEIDDYSKKYTK